MAVVEDKTIIDEAEAVIDAAYTDAAAALVPAELIDEANAEAVAATLHPQFVEIVDLLTGAGLDIDMETNGTLIDVDLAHYLKDETSLNFVSVSIDGAQAETHDALRRVPGAFDAALLGVDSLVDAGYQNVQVIACPHRGNIDELEDVVQLASDHGTYSVKFNPVTRSGRGIAMHERGEALGFWETLALVRYVRGDLQSRTSV